MAETTLIGIHSTMWRIKGKISSRVFSHWSKEKKEPPNPVTETQREIVSIPKARTKAKIPTKVAAGAEAKRTTAAIITTTTTTSIQKRGAAATAVAVIAAAAGTTAAVAVVAVMATAAANTEKKTPEHADKPTSSDATTKDGADEEVLSICGSENIDIGSPIMPSELQEVIQRLLRKRP